MARILITAGPTRAAIDDVRFLTNASSGRMALALVKAARAAGHDVIVVSGPVAIDYPAGVEVVRVTATSEMLAACLDRLPRVDGVIAAAAPCDFEPIKRVAGKIPRRGTTLVLRLRPTVDVIATVARKAKGSQWMVAFALEPGADPRRALEKITTKRCDLIVVNDLSAIDAARTAVTVYDRTHARVGARLGTKAAVASWLIRLIGKKLM